MSDKVPIRDLHASTGLPSLNQMVVRSTLVETWKIMHNESGVDHSIFEKVDSVTRAASEDKVKLPKNINGNGAGFVYNGAKIWSMAPPDIKLAKNLSSAKRKIKTFAELYQ